MAVSYHRIDIYTSEDTRYHGKAAWDLVMRRVQELHIAARCIVYCGFAGCYENGEIASSFIEVEAFNMPIKIEILLPSAELDTVMSIVEELLPDGLVSVHSMDVRLHRCHQSLIPRQMLVRDAMTASPVSVTADTSVADVVQILVTHEFNGLPVVDDKQQPIGIITQNDLITRASMPVRLGMLSDFSREQLDSYLNEIAELTAQRIMTHPVVCIESSRRLFSAVDIMLKNKLKRLLVIGSDRKLIGMLARADIFHVISRAETPEQSSYKLDKIISTSDTVCSIADRNVCMAYDNTPLTDVIRNMSESGSQRAVVVDSSGKLIGMIFDSDLLGLFSDHKASIWSHLMCHLPLTDIAARHKMHLRQSQQSTAGDVMKKELVTILDNASIEEAINIMIHHQIKRLPVVDRQGIFMGIVSRDAVLRASV